MHLDILSDLTRSLPTISESDQMLMPMMMMKIFLRLPFLPFSLPPSPLSLSLTLSLSLSLPTSAIYKGENAADACEKELPVYCFLPFEEMHVRWALANRTILYYFSYVVLAFGQYSWWQTDCKCHGNQAMVYTYIHTVLKWPSSWGLFGWFSRKPERYRYRKGSKFMDLGLEK